jgi:hypothetical protein
MEQQPNGQLSGETPLSKRDFFDVYKLALDDLHRTKSLGQKIDSLYVSILSLLLTADAYEIATTRLNSWVPVAATAGVAVIGIAVASRWRRGTYDLFKITTNRYAWLRAAEQTPAMKKIGANVFTQEWQAVYLPQASGRDRTEAAGSPGAGGISRFNRRTEVLQTLGLTSFALIPLILAAATYLNEHRSLLPF